MEVLHSIVQRCDAVCNGLRALLDKSLPSFSVICYSKNIPFKYMENVTDGVSKRRIFALADLFNFLAENEELRKLHSEHCTHRSKNSALGRTVFTAVVTSRKISVARLPIPKTVCFYL
jgi:hypothetical protein